MQYMNGQESPEVKSEDNIQKAYFVPCNDGFDEDHTFLSRQEKQW